MYTSSTSFSKKTAFLSKMTSLLWYLTEDLNLFGQFDRSVGLTTQCALMKVSENIEIPNSIGCDPHKNQNTC